MRLLFWPLAIFMLHPILSSACQCRTPSECSLVTEILIAGEVKEIYVNGNYINKSRGTNDFGAEKIAYLQILNSDDTSLVDKWLRIYITRGYNCSTNMHYGFYYMQFHFLYTLEDTIDASVTACSVKQFARDTAFLNQTFRRHLKQKLACYLKATSRSVLVEPETPYNTSSMDWPKLSETADSLFNTQVQHVYDSLTIKPDTVYADIFVNEYGAVYDVNITNAIPADEWSNFTRAVKQLKFPPLRFKKSDYSLEYGRYKFTVLASTIFRKD